MLRLNFQKIFALRGIKKPLAFLVDNGLSYSVAWRFLSGEAVRADLHHLGNLCYRLNCTPNDVLHWVPGPKTPELPGHALLALQPKKDEPTLAQLLNEFPTDKIKDLEKAIAGLKNEKAEGK